jgi:hypothetical protein
MKLRNVTALICVLALAGSVSALPTPIAYFPFETITAGVTPNAVDAGNNGTVTGATLIAGKVGNALNFVAANAADKVDVAGGLEALEADPNIMSVTFWIKGSAALGVGEGTPNPNYASIVRINDLNHAGPGITFASHGTAEDNSLVRTIWDIPDIRMLPSPNIDRNYVADLSGSGGDNDWHHFAFTADKSGGVAGADYMHMYIDGQYVATGGENWFAVGADLTSYVIGAHTNGSQWMDGGIDELAIWGVALTLAEIQEISGIPEPTTLVLLGVGLALSLVAKARRRSA